MISKEVAETWDLAKIDMKIVIGGPNVAPHDHVIDFPGLVPTTIV